MTKRVRFYGVGVKDIPTPTQWIERGKIVYCKAYKAWCNILKRCYHKPDAGYTMSPDWLIFSNFKKWFDENYQEDFVLNNVLFGDGTHYSEETVVFLDKTTHHFIKNTEFKIGVCNHLGLTKQKQSEKFHVRCSNPFTVVQEHVGYFDTEEKAVAAWIERKQKHAKKVAELHTDDRIKQEILNRF
jgi:hypothetical protein